MGNSIPTFIDPEDVKRDIDAILWSMRLCSVRRFFHQRFWEVETQEAEYAGRIESFPRLESVAEHSWHVADTVMLLAGHFPALDVAKCLKLALLHDKMEIITGDRNPVGKDGTGGSTHAFNVLMRLKKDSCESEALNLYLSKLRKSIVHEQLEIIEESILGTSQESLFVKAVDKLQALAYVYQKKAGRIGLKHLGFTLRYSRKIPYYFSGLHLHYDELFQRLLQSVATYHKLSIDELKASIGMNQLHLGTFKRS